MKSSAFATELSEPVSTTEITCFLFVKDHTLWRSEMKPRHVMQPELGVGSGVGLGLHFYYALVGEHGKSALGFGGLCWSIFQNNKKQVRQLALYNYSHR